MNKKDIPILIILIIAIIVVICASTFLLKDKQKRSNRIVKETPSNLKISTRENVIDNDNNEIISIGDEIIFSEEHFMVIGTNEETNTIKLVTKYSLNPEELKQDEKCKGYESKKKNTCSISFSEINYWKKESNYIYSEETNLYPYINKYLEYLKTKGNSPISGSLLSIEDLKKLNCTYNNKEIDCEKSYEWLKNTTFWLGNNKNEEEIYVINQKGNGDSIPYNDKKATIKLIITISAAEI